MEKDKAWVLMEDGEPIAICFNRADMEELFMDLVMEAQFGAFCWNWYQQFEDKEHILRCIHLLLSDLNMLRMEYENEKYV